MPKRKRNPRFQVTLPEHYSRLLDSYCEITGDAPASFSAVAIRNELERIEQEGKIDLFEKFNIVSRENEILKNFLLSLNAGESVSEKEVQAIASIFDLETSEIHFLVQKTPVTKAD